jgi:hypothetical protein
VKPIIPIALAALLWPGASMAQVQTLGDLGWLVGAWDGEGGGAQQKGAGGFSFTPDISGHVLVRRNVAEYPAADGKPASRHDDLMVIYQDGRWLKADYWDSEGHVIRYTVQTVTPRSVVFLSETAPGPRYRLTYRRSDTGLAGAFEIAEPSDPGHFHDALAWTARRSRGGGSTGDVR